MTEVLSMIKDPFDISSDTFSDNTYNNATLYVPSGSKDKYKAVEGWKKFMFIKEKTGQEKCEKPTISYQNGKLTFDCETEGVTFQSTITDADINSFNSKEVQLGVTYNIYVYATKTGYEDSETATATLCWIEADPKAEGLNSIAQIKANAVMIKTDGGQLTIEGANDNTNITVYRLDGVQVGSAFSKNGVAHVYTNLIRDSITIVKIGNKSVKVLVK